MNLVEFTDRYGHRVMVNAGKVLALYQNDAAYKPDNSHKGAYTYIELSPPGCSDGDGAGPVVAHTIDEVRECLQKNTQFERPSMAPTYRG